MKRLLIASIVLFANLSFAQDTTFKLGDFDFRTRTKTKSNEWDTKDSISTLYRIEDGKKICLLKYYPFEDRGGDCNNLFWLKERMTVNENLITFNTTYFQKTNIDPIPTARRQIYSVNKKGQLNLIFDKYRYRDSREWVDEY
jgi:hypothetical protein